ncbi:MAG: hypothetical protein ACRETN_02985 [Nevskiales bacterium]
MRASRIRHPNSCPVLLQTLRVTVQILLLRAGPQDLPSSWRLLSGLVAAYVLLNALVLRLGMSEAQAVLHAVAVSAMLALYTRWLLRRTGKDVRFAQTFTALLMIGIALGLAALPCMIELQPFLEQLRVLKDGQEPPPAPVLALLGYMTISLWHLLAMAQVYRHALEVTLGRGAMLALLYELLLLVMIRVVAGLTGS